MSYTFYAEKKQQKKQQTVKACFIVLSFLKY